MLFFLFFFSTRKKEQKLIQKKKKIDFHWKQKWYIDTINRIELNGIDRIESNDRKIYVVVVVDL